MIADPLLLHLMRSLADDAHASVSGRAEADARRDRRWFTVGSLVRAAAEAGRARIRLAASSRIGPKKVQLPSCDCAGAA